MSTKILPHSPVDPDIHHFIIFIVLSIVIHLGVVFGLFTYAPFAERVLKLISPAEKEPVIVDVVELPPLPPGAIPRQDFKKPPTHYADRTQSVERETYPEPTRIRPILVIPRGVFVPPQAGSGGDAGGKPGENGFQKEGSINGEKGPGSAAASKEEGLPVKTSDDGFLKGTASGNYSGVETVDPQASGNILWGFEGNRYGVGTGNPQAGGNGTGTGRSSSGPFRRRNRNPQAGGNGTGTGRSSKTMNQKPSLFLSDERISELAKNYEAESPKGERGKTLQLNTSELKYQKYLLAMKDGIERKWEYPAIASRNGWQGILRINFTINKDGTVSDIKFIKSSDYPVLDDSAMTALKLAAPFPPFPENFSVEEIKIKGTFEYVIISPAAR